MTTIIQRHMLKKKLLEACINKQHSLIEDFKARISSLLSSEGIGNEEMYDNSELSQTSQKAIEINSVNATLEFANQELEVLRWLTTQEIKQHDKVELGALVVTNQGSFFVSVSAELINVDSDPFIGISVHSPLFLAMRGKKKGDSISCNGTSYKINDIH
jgi:transcription elongation GreA/GreB family factor